MTDTQAPIQVTPNKGSMAWLSQRAVDVDPARGESAMTDRRLTAYRPTESGPDNPRNPPSPQSAGDALEQAMTNGFCTEFGTVLKGTSVKMSEYPERISISPVYRQKRDNDFYLVDRDAFPGKGTEYVRADLLEAEVIKAAEELAQVLSSILERRGDCFIPEKINGHHDWDEDAESAVSTFRAAQEKAK